MTPFASPFTALGLWGSHAEGHGRLRSSLVSADVRTTRHFLHALPDATLDQ